jgi:translation initiation factor IF-2
MRVHELAKEFGLDNKEVITLLQAAGISAKTHSSSVYEDEARAVLQKATTQEEKPKARKRPGMMIVRKRKVADAEDAPETEEPTEAVDIADAAPVEVPESVESTAPAEVVADTPVAGTEPVTDESAPPLEAAADELVEAGEAVEAVEPGESGEAVEAVEPGESGEAGEAVEPVEAAEAAPSVEAVTQPPAKETVTKPAAQETAPKAAPEKAAAGKATAEKKPKEKGTRSATVVRMIDRDKLIERAGRRVGGGQSQRQQFGKVTELRVVNDPFGRGREMVDVGRDKKGRPGSKPGVRKRAPTKREMMEMRERAMHPSRLKKKKAIKRATKKTEVTQPKASKRVIKMKETIAVSDLAHQLGVKAVELIRKLMSLGVPAGINDPLDFDTAQLIAQDHEYTVESVAFAEDEVLAVRAEDEKPEDLEPRPPVVTVMGHVDHGKTSLLDYIRKTRVTAGEAGGITQHIGAYQVRVGKKGLVTFLDTPGHAAFTSMRARGAQVTDIVVLVVAADDGVMPQTEEAIRHAQAAKVPIIVAVNKIDKPDSNPDRVIQDLTQFQLVPEAWGGDTLVVNTSATKGTGVDDLLATILLQAEVLELTANAKRPAEGIVVEAKLDKGRGPVATVLVQKGTLNRGDPVVVGGAYGKVRAMTDAQRKQLKSAGPSAAVEITGLDSVPEAGDVMNVVENADAAKDVAEHRREQSRRQQEAASPKRSLEELMARMQGNEALELKLVLKGDVKGSVEAVREALIKLSTDEVKVNVIQYAVGGITESDIMLAAASDGLVVGFGVRPDTNARQVAEREGVEIRTYKIIYEMVDDVKKAMEGLLEPEINEKIVGHAEVRELFRVSKVGTIAGCRVVDGKAMRSAKVRVLRDSVQVYEGRVASLKHFKDDAREVETGLECGCGVDGFNDVKQGDVLEFFQVEEIARTLDGGASGKRSAPVRPQPSA